MGLSTFKFFWWTQNKNLFCKIAYRPFKVIYFGMNWKHICDFLLVWHSNLGPILPRFRYCRFLRSWPHPYSTLMLGVFPLDLITNVGVSMSTNLKLFSREITFEVFQPMWSHYLNVTDGRTTYCGITALCIASCGKNESGISIWDCASLEQCKTYS